MAKYYLEPDLKRLKTCIVDRDTKTIHVPRPTTFIELHRELQDLFDDYDWMVEIAPTMRVTDHHGELRPPWLMNNVEFVDGVLELWNDQ